LLLGARGENDFKLVQMNLEEFWRKEIQKKNRKGAGAAGPTPPPFRPSERPGLPLGALLPIREIGPDERCSIGLLLWLTVGGVRSTFVKRRE